MSSELCQNCFAKEIVCRGLREYESRTCCGQCEHALPPDIRVESPRPPVSA